MTAAAHTHAPTRPPRGLVPILETLAVASGAASLVYQVAWMRRLVLVFGSTTLATSTVLAAFLGGLAVGAWLWGRVADRRPRAALGVFGLVEAGIGLYALASPLIFRAAEAIYLGLYPVVAGRPGAFVGVQFLLSVLVILVPAALMGGTLPLLVRHVTTGGAMIRGVGVLYGWNTAGAAAGAALATYGLLPAVGLSGAVRAAAAVNLLIGGAALLLDSRHRRAGGEEGGAPVVAVKDAANAPASEGDPDGAAVVIVLQGFALSGMAAIVYEVAWSRLLAMIMGSSVYAFGTLVVVVLAGLAIGSGIYGRLRIAARGHLAAFAVLETCIAATAAASLLVVPHLPFVYQRLLPIFKDSFAWWVAVQIGLTGLLAFVPSVLLGATFPAVVGSLGGALARVGRTIGVAYGANTVGTVAGAYLAGFVLIPALGLRATVVIGVLANLLAGLSALVVIGRSWRLRAPAVLPAAAALLIIVALPSWPREIFAAGTGFYASWYGSVEELEKAVAEMRLLYYRDGINTTISVNRVGDFRVYRSNGKTDASTYPTDMANQLLLGYVPMLLHPAPRDVFVLGLGTGVTAAAVARFPVRRIDIGELEPAALEAARFFEAQNRAVLDDPRVRTLIGDGRNRLLAARDQYDVVISDPSDVWVAGMATLFTREFYETVRARLRPGGLMVQWIHTHTLAPPEFALLLATFRSVFPHMSLWSPGVGDLILMGSVDPVGWEHARLSTRFAQTPGAREDLQSVGIWHPVAVFAAFVAGEETLAAYTASVRQLHRDDRPVLEFVTPRFLYVDTTAGINDALQTLRSTPMPPLAGFDPSRDMDPDATYLLGFAYASLGRPALGIPYMERSIQMAPGRAAFHVGLANQYRDAGRRREAAAAYQRAIAVDPGQVEARVALGELRLEDGQVREALDLATAALRIDPANERAKTLATRARERLPQ
jgi:spermidine synthase